MKESKKFCLIMLIFLLILSGCSESRATTYNSKSIDNAFNNFSSGGKLSYINNNLYVIYNTADIFNLGIFKINSEKVENVFYDTKVDYISSETPKFYNYQNELYVYRFNESLGYSELLKYDNDEKNLSKTEFTEHFYGEKFYLSDNMLVFYSPLSNNAKNKDYSLTVKTDKTTFVSDVSVSDFCVDGNNVFFTTDGWLYKLNTTSNKDIELISEKSFEHDKIFIANNEYIYFNFSGSNLSEYKTGLYRYSLKNKDFKLIFKGDINSANTYNGKLYFATDKGIFEDDPSDKYKKISGISTKELYILDTDWIYSLNDTEGKIYRISFDGKSTEHVDFLLPKKQ